MDVVRLDGPMPRLRRPVLVAAFRGWNDAGESASTAVDLLADLEGAEDFADIDPEEFFDFTAVRPLVRRAEGDEREIEWPLNQLTWAPLPGVERDVVVLSGVEPGLRWRTFTGAVVGMAQHLGVELFVTLGALQVDVPHTRPTPLTANTSDPSLARRLPPRSSRYEGPTGITGVLSAVARAADIPTVALWAGVPHYLAASVYDAGALTLTTALGRLLEVHLPLDELQHDADRQAEEISELLAQDDDLAEYVTELERRTDSASVVELNVVTDSADLPRATVSGDELAAEFERYLRERRGDS